MSKSRRSTTISSEAVAFALHLVTSKGLDLGLACRKRRLPGDLVRQMSLVIGDLESTFGFISSAVLMRDVTLDSGDGRSSLVSVRLTQCSENNCLIIAK